MDNGIGPQAHEEIYGGIEQSVLHASWGEVSFDESVVTVFCCKETTNPTVVTGATGNRKTGPEICGKFRSVNDGTDLDVFKLKGVRITNTGSMDPVARGQVIRRIVPVPTDQAVGDGNAVLARIKECPVADYLAGDG